MEEDTEEKKGAIYMTKEDYLIIGKVIAKHYEYISIGFVRDLVNALKEDNDRFNEQSFLNYISKTYHTEYEIKESHNEC
jgi:hypothetical protein